MSLALFRILLVSIFIFSQALLSAASAAWTGPRVGNWNTNANWTPAAFPNGATDTATFSNIPGVPGISINHVDLSTDIELQTLQLNITEDNFLIPTNTTGGNKTFTIRDSIVFGGNGFIYISNFVDILFPTNGTINMSVPGSPLTEFSIFRPSILTCPGTLSVIGPGVLRINSENVDVSALTLSGGVSITGALGTSLQNTDTLVLGADTVATFNGDNVNATLAADISGAGSVVINQAQNVTTTFTGTNSYTGGTTIAARTFIGSTDSIPSNGGVVNNGVSLIFQQGINAAYSGVISGTGALVKRGTGVLTLSNTNTYLGGTTILQGSLTGSTASIPSAGGIVNNGVNLTFNQTADGSYSGPISGTGALVKTGNGVLTLTGANTYTGTTTISVGSLTGSTASIPSAGGIVNNGFNLTFNQSFTGTYSGPISGTGAFNKIGKGVVTLSNTNTYTGLTTITGGTLSVTGATAAGGSVEVEAGGRLSGNGSVGNVNNYGVVQAGLMPGDVLTLRNYTEVGISSVFTSLIDIDASSRLNVEEIATLAGVLLLVVEPGVYTTDTSYNVLIAAGGLDNTTFASVVGSIGTWRATYGATTVSVNPLVSFVATPVPLSSLSGNDAAVGDYMFADGTFVASNPDLTLVANVMLTGTGDLFRESLIRVSPLPTAANPQTQLQGNLQMAVVLDKQFQQKVKEARRNEQKEKKVPCYGIPRTGLFIEPIGVFYHQRQTGGALTNGGQVAFDSYTYGAGMGWEQVLDNKFVVEGGIGYTHSNLHWHENFGNSRWSTIYLAPFFGWFNERFFANFMVMAGFNFLKTDRKVAFGTINRNATSRYNSYDLLLRLNGGARIPFGEINWFQPEVTLNYLTVFTEAYREKGASSISLQVQRNTTYIMQPSFRGKWIQEFKTEKFCYSPILYVGWLANIMLQPQTVSARFRDAPNQIFFNIEGYSGTVNQLILGAEFFVQRFNQFQITSSFEVDMLSHFEVYTGKVKFEWMF